MAEASFNELTVTFTPEFKSFITLYKGIDSVRIGDNGVLYASYVDGEEQEVGPVTSFYYAKQQGFSGTFSDWVTLLQSSTSNAEKAEAYAVGKKNGQDVPVTDATYHNNALYWADQSKKWAVKSDNTAQPGDNNCSQSWATTSAEYAGTSESWAVGTRGGTADTKRSGASTNNSKYWSDQAETSSNTAEQWATGGTGGTPSANNNAKKYSELSQESNLQSESWAVGTRDGSADSVRTNASTNNSKYWSDQSANSASTASQALSSIQNIQSDINSNVAVSANYVLKAEGWAKGTHNNTPVSDQDEAYQKSAKWYADLASSSAGNASASETNAAASATNAADSASSASASASSAAQSSSNASLSESNSLQYKEDAEDAKDAAEEAQSKAEFAISHQPRINASDNWETWNIVNEAWEDTGHKSMANATVSYAYQNSTSGTIIPSGTWNNNPLPQEGKYMWSRITYTWTNGRVDNLYNVSYMGVNGTGSVDSVNGLSGAVILDSSNIYIDYDDTSKGTMYDVLTHIGNSISNNEIDGLF